MTRPTDYAHPQADEWSTGGLTIREEFAARCMQALLTVCIPRGGVQDVHQQARAAVAAADALIAALNERHG
jgi:hypothetical protein